MKKLNKKGFSLVELIVVVAIMAVLVGVLAPSLLRYVEKTRVQKDISAVSEVVRAAEIAMADENVNTEVGITGQAISFSCSGGAYTLATSGTDKELEIEVSKTIATIDLTSNGLKGATVAITAKVTATGSVEVKATAVSVQTDDAVTAFTDAFGAGTATKNATLG